MYYQTDYILRMIEMMGDFWRRLFRLMDEQKYEDATRLIDDLLQHHVGLNYDALMMLTTESLLTALSGEQRAYASEALWLRADLLDALAQPDEAASARKRAFALLRSVWQDDTDWAAMRYAQVKRWIDIAGCDDMLWAARFFECAGQYADAEDALDQELALGPEAKAWGVAFYRRLLGLPDDALSRGGLPREEVYAGLKRLESDRL